MGDFFALSGKERREALTFAASESGRARHWHDVTRLDAAGLADAAIADEGLAKNVAEHKAIFFAEKDSDGNAIDYVTAVSGGLRLIPAGGALEKLAADYQHMVDDGLFLDDAEPFDALISRCKAVERKANKITRT